MIKEITYEEYKLFVEDKILDFYTQSSEVRNIATIPIKYLGHFVNNQLIIVANYYTLKYKKIFKVACFVQSEVFASDISQEKIIDYYKALKNYFKHQHYAYINVYPTMKIGEYDLEGQLKTAYFN